MDLRNLKVGYVPYTSALEKPGDRRRFVFYARARGINFEIADPSKQYDIVVLSERADLSVWSRYTKGRLVFDLIDSYLAVPQTDLKGALRGIAKFASRQSRYLQLSYRDAVAEMCRRSDAVVCTTEEQRKAIQKYSANVHVVLDAHTMVARVTKTDYSTSTPFRIVWEGMPQTLMTLVEIFPAIEELRRRQAIEVHVITDRTYAKYLGVHGRTDALKTLKRISGSICFHEWREEDCARIICSCDLAVIPLPLNDPFIAGKPENKLLLFWRLGMPTVVSATPAYTRAMDAAGVAMYCRTTQDWVLAIEGIMRDRVKREEAARRGKVFVDSNFSEAQLIAAWDEIFKSVAT